MNVGTAGTRLARRFGGTLLLFALAAPAGLAQGGAESRSEPIKPVVVRVSEPRKETDRDVLFPIVLETSGTASIGRVRVEMDLTQMEGWKFRRLDLSRGLDLRNNVRTRNVKASGSEPARLSIEWDLSGEGKELPAGHVAMVRVQAERDKTPAGAPSSDNPPVLTVRKLSWGFAEMERPPDDLPQLNTPDNITGNPDVSCFFFTH